MKKKFWLLISLLACAGTLAAQNQLVAVRKGSVVTFWNVGDDIILWDRKGQQQSGTITRIDEFSLLIRTDSIAFSQIEKIDCKGRLSPGIVHTIGDLLFKAGAGYFLLHQANEIILQGNGFDKDPSVWQPALAVAGTGWVLRKIKPRYLHTGYKVRLKQARYGTLLYQRR
ncbi:MAG: hypothetical protein K1X47_04115 [Cyclobacteriaceae bacterium]|nr:hypothetical protein [Cyclobacteriaceae bacterium]